MNYSLEQLKELNGKVNGNYSIVYPLIKDRLDVYTDEEIPFAGEFLFFEDKYFPIAIDLKKKNIKEPIIDIGCQYGFQSEFFENYTGIDVEQMRFFNKEKENVNYIVNDFMKLNIDLTESTVLSIMSLGYFNKYISKELSENEVDELIADKLAKSKRLYISTTSNLHSLLEKKFKSKTLIYNSNTNARIDGKIVDGIGAYSVYLYE